MALTEAQIIECLQILGLPARTDIAFQFAGDSTRLRNTEVARQLLATLNADQENAVTDILTQFDSLKYDTDFINASGLDSDPFRARNRLKVVLTDTIGFSPLPGTGGGMRLARG